MTKDLWTPQQFEKDFANTRITLTNCITSEYYDKMKISDFFGGFINMYRRPKDGNGEPLIVKIKDWPSEEDFAKIMPLRYDDIMRGYPIKDYTQRDGIFNLASSLPDFLVVPDLGPKMYIAYGSALQPKSASTNLHLDMSDATNLMVYTGAPVDDVNQLKASRDAVRKECPCKYTNERMEEKEVPEEEPEVPGALWHIFLERDSDKIREFLKGIEQVRTHIFTVYN